MILKGIEKIIPKEYMHMSPSQFIAMIYRKSKYI